MDLPLLDAHTNEGMPRDVTRGAILLARCVWSCLFSFCFFFCFANTERWSHCGSASSSDGAPFEQRIMADGVQAWTDRVYEYKHVAEELIGSTLLAGPHRHGDSMVKVAAEPGSTVYLFTRVHPTGCGFGNLGWRQLPDRDGKPMLSDTTPVPLAVWRSTMPTAALLHIPLSAGSVGWCTFGIAIACSAKSNRSRIPNPLSFDLDPCDVALPQDPEKLSPFVSIHTGFFTDFRIWTWNYYVFNATPYEFLWLNSFAFSNMELLQHGCPAAALQALLIRAEERWPMLESGHALAEYALLYQGIPADIRDDATSRWPLNEALVRLRQLNMQAPPVAEMKPHTVDMVIAYCDESLDELVAVSLEHNVPLHGVNLVLYSPETCLQQHGVAVPPNVARVGDNFKSVEVLQVNVGQASWEPARYLMHIVTRFDRLADFTFFVHADIFEHVMPRMLRNLLQAMFRGALTWAGQQTGASERWYEHLSLAHNYLTDPSRARQPTEWCSSKAYKFESFWYHLFGATAESQEPVQVDNFSIYCCSSFVVHRDRIRKRPREWYLSAGARNDWGECAASYMELLWHAMFNDGQLHEEKRQLRPELPLFLRLDNFQEQNTAGS